MSGTVFGKTNVVAELGLDYAQENYVAGIDPNYQGVLAARALLGVNLIVAVLGAVLLIWLWQTFVK